MPPIIMPEEVAYCCGQRMRVVSAPVEVNGDGTRIRTRYWKCPACGATAKTTDDLPSCGINNATRIASGRFS